MAKPLPRVAKALKYAARYGLAQGAGSHFNFGQFGHDRDQENSDSVEA